MPLATGTMDQLLLCKETIYLARLKRRSQGLGTVGIFQAGNLKYCVERGSRLPKKDLSDLCCLWVTRFPTSLLMRPCLDFCLEIGRLQMRRKAMLGALGQEVGTEEFWKDGRVSVDCR